MSLEFVVNVITGISLGLANIVLVRKLIPRVEKQVWGIGLIIAALVYVGFLTNGAEGDWFWIESVGVIL
jgi:NhaP-type Na+/H+ or K+/H+ antiporter